MRQGWQVRSAGRGRLAGRDGLRIAAAAGAAALGAGIVMSGAVAVTPVTTQLVSLTSTGGQTTSGTATGAALSGNGRYVAFQVASVGMTPETDTNNTNDVFVRDTVAGTTTLVSVDTSDADTGNGNSTQASLADTGVTLAAFTSTSSDLNPLDTNSTGDVFVRDWTTAAANTELVSVNAAGTAGGDGASERPDITPDGRYVVFSSAATDLVANDTNGPTTDVFLRDRVAGTTTLVSRTPGGAAGIGASNNAVISDDGSTIAFRSLASDLVTGDNNNVADFFVYTVATGAVERVNVDSAGVQADAATGVSALPAIDADGSVVAFASDATNLVAGDTNGRSDIFVRDRAAGTTTRVSVDSAGAQHNSTSSNILAAWNPALDAAGRLIAFSSNATNLIPGDTAANSEVFVHDRVYATTDVVSVPQGGGTSGGNSVTPTIAADGLTVAYQSTATNLVTGDANLLTDIFVTPITVPAPPASGPVYVLPSEPFVPLMTELAAVVGDLELATIDPVTGVYSVPGCSTTTSPLPAGNSAYIDLLAGDPYAAATGTTGPVSADCLPDAVTVYGD